LIIASRIKNYDGCRNRQASEQQKASQKAGAFFFDAAAS
jgi:hypothetical protein